MSINSDTKGVKMIGKILKTTEIKELRSSDNQELISLHNVLVMGQSCIRLGNPSRTDEIFEVVVNELGVRGLTVISGELI